MLDEQVINYILNTEDSSIITENNLTVDYFSECPVEFSFIKNHLDVYGKVPDKETFFSKFQDFSCINVSEPITYLLDELSKKKAYHDATEVYRKLGANLNAWYSGDAEAVEKTMAEIKKLGEISTSTVNIKAVDLFKDTSRYDAYVERMDNKEDYFIPTGFKELDELIGGWDVQEELATIVARTGKGKSWFLIKSAAEAAKSGKRIGLYSGEMSDMKVGYRLDTLLGNISNGALVHGGSSVKNEYKKFIDETLKSYTGCFYVITPKDLGGPATVSMLRAFVEKYNLDILFIDQHSLLEDEHKAKNPVEKAANISKDLKLLQTTKRIPIISVSQQNRTQSDSGEFDTTQVAQSDRIAQDSTVIIFIERDGDRYTLHPAKLRDAECNKPISYIVDLNTGYFTYSPEEADADKEVSDSRGEKYSDEDVFC